MEIRSEWMCVWRGETSSVKYLLEQKVRHVCVSCAGEMHSRKRSSHDFNLIISSRLEQIIVEQNRFYGPPMMKNIIFLLSCLSRCMKKNLKSGWITNSGRLKDTETCTYGIYTYIHVFINVYTYTCIYVHMEACSPRKVKLGYSTIGYKRSVTSILLNCSLSREGNGLVKTFWGFAFR